MTQIKLCGLTRACDIEAANALEPDYIGFVFAPKSKRYVSREQADVLRKKLKKGIVPVGVFVNEDIEVIVALLRDNIIEAVQLHGTEDAAYIKALRERSDCTIIQAFRIERKEDIQAANASTADYVLLDSGGGSGETFNWFLIGEMNRSYFLAGGLTPENVEDAIDRLQPFGVDASSSLETEGCKEQAKMSAFVRAVRDSFTKDKSDTADRA